MKLTFKRDQRQLRSLMREEDHVFNPGGAASVRITFDLNDRRAVALAIRDGDLHVQAQRAG